MNNKLLVSFERLHADARVPRYGTEQAAGADLCAVIDGQTPGAWFYDVRNLWMVDLKLGERRLIKTGIAIALPESYEAQIRPRSGLALKDGITVLNTPGTIDADYRGEIGVILYNASDRKYVVANGDRIAQLVVAPVVRACFVEEELTETRRGAGGFGSTGVA